MPRPILLDRAEMLAALDDLDRKLAAQAQPRQQLIVVGGSYLALAELRQSTRDVDVATRLAPVTRRAIEEVAVERGLPRRWLNDDAAAFLPAGLNVDSCDVVFDGSALTVLAPSADWIFLMKLYAARVVDRPDMVRLWPHSGFESAAAAVARYWDAYPHAVEDEHLVGYVAEIARKADSGGGGGVA